MLLDSIEIMEVTEASHIYINSIMAHDSFMFGADDWVGYPVLKVALWNQTQFTIYIPIYEYVNVVLYHMKS